MEGYSRGLQVELHAQLDTSNGVLATTHRTTAPNVAKAAFVSMLGEVGFVFFGDVVYSF